MDEVVIKKLTPRRWQRSDSKKWGIVKDVEGGYVLLPDNLAELLLEMNDGSEQFLGLLKSLIEDPVEKWLHQLKSEATGEIRLVAIYFGIFLLKDSQQKLFLILKCDPMEGKWVASDLFQVTDGEADMLRSGILMYNRPKC